MGVTSRWVKATLIGWMTMSACVAGLAQSADRRPVDAKFCDVVRNPSKYVGRDLLVRVQAGLAGPLGPAVLTEPPSPEFKINVLLYEKECVAGIEFEVPPPKGWLPDIGGMAMGAPWARQFPVIRYGPAATVVARIRFAPEPETRPRIVRDSTGNIVEAHFNDIPFDRSPEIVFVIERIVAGDPPGAEK